MKPNVYTVQPWKASATNAERDSIKYMQVKYMQDHQDQEFGVISVTEWGILLKLLKTSAKEWYEFAISKTIIIHSTRNNMFSWCYITINYN
jgi:exoribonuclease R